MQRCELKKAKQCDTNTRYFDYAGWVCDGCYQWLRGG
jgi:hypothetical protein